MTYAEIEENLKQINHNDTLLIEKQADEFLQRKTLQALKNKSVDDEEFQHRVMMDTFYASMLNVLTEKCPDIEKFVEHDISSWIEANSEIITVHNLQKIEQELSKNSYRNLVKFHQQIDFDMIEFQQNLTLQKIWEVIESKINEELQKMN